MLYYLQYFYVLFINQKGLPYCLLVILMTENTEKSNKYDLSLSFLPGSVSFTFFGRLQKCNAPADLWYLRSGHSKGLSCILNISWINFNKTLREIFLRTWTKKDFLPHLPQDQAHLAAFGRQCLQSSLLTP